MTPVEKAIADYGLTKLARAMGVPVQTVAAWKARKSLPAERAIEFESITGASRHVTRPDVFGPPTPAEAAE